MCIRDRIQNFHGFDTVQTECMKAFSPISVKDQIPTSGLDAYQDADRKPGCYRLYAFSVAEICDFNRFSFSNCLYKGKKDGVLQSVYQKVMLEQQDVYKRQHIRRL